MNEMRLFKRKSTWYVQLERGKARSLKTGDRAKAAAIVKKIEQKNLISKLIDIEGNKRILLAKFAEDYINDRVGKRADNTVRLDRESLGKLIQFVGNLPVTYLYAKKVDEFVSYLIKSKLKSVTINLHIRHLRAAFNKAVKWDLIEKSPFRNISELPIKDKIPKSLNAEDIEKLLNVIDNQEFIEYIYACLYTGGRRTEVARLKWENFQCFDNIWYLTLKDSKDENKVIPVSEKLQHILFYRKKDIGPVFPYYYYHYREASKHFRKFADRAGIRNKLHDLRHTCATFMILNGIPLKIVQQILGHANIKTTEIYTKLLAKHLKEGVDALNF